MRGQVNGDLLLLKVFQSFPKFSKVFQSFPKFSKVFQSFPKFYNFFLPKVETGVLFDYYDIVSKEEKQNKDLVHSKSECIIFCINFLLESLIDQDSSKFTGGMDIIEYSN